MENFYNLTVTEFSSALIVLNILIAFVLQLVIVWVYKKTHKGLSYSPSFIFTMIIVGVLGSVVMMIVQNNLVGAFALLGAFSLIRFRTILKETRDIAFVFFALVIGIGVGTSNYAIATIATFLVTAIILLLERYNVGDMSHGLGMILTCNATRDIDAAAIEAALSRYVDSFNLLQASAYDTGLNHYIFSLKLKHNLESVAVLNELQKCQEFTNIELVTGEHTVEY